MELPVEAPEIIEVVAVPTQENQPVPVAEKVNITAPEISKPTISNEPKISALSLSSIRAKRELEQTVKPISKEQVQLPTEPFNETDMLLYWNKYAQKLGDKGQKIMESLLLINDPVLNGTAITLELPNEGSKIDFETEKNGLLGYLKGHLHNHDITIEVIVNEAVQTKKTYSNQDRYNRLHEINPAIEVLRSTFGLDINN
ncbi:DNA polymerase III subunit gamma/tau [Flavobacterium lotistagni]|uniref:DNA polymerase III subunit gamma/tau n=1 Tax=Flavobacterium lotistagni TaxID=2709660 RepID=UPI001F239783|nr:DNA polymerase III subunit gamma/tau [Flavobacterium lotistagni]